VVEPVLKLFASNIAVGILFVDGESARFFVQRGTRNEEVASLGCRRRAATRKGGQSAERFQRQRKNDVKGWKAQINGKAAEVFAGVKIVVVCGNGPLYTSCLPNIPSTIVGVPMQHAPSPSVCRRLYEEWAPIVAKLSFHPVTKRLTSLGSRGDERIVYGPKELGAAIRDGALKTLVIGASHLHRFDVGMAENMGCTVHVIPFDAVVETVYGGAIGESWY